MGSVEDHLLRKIDEFGHVGYGTLVMEQSVFTKKDRIRLSDHVRIDDFVKIEGGRDAILGNNVHVASFAHLNIGGGTLLIEEGAAIASGVKIITGGNQVDAPSMSRVAAPEDQRIEYGTVILRKNACILTGAIVIGKAGQVLEIGEGARVAAGAVLTKSVPPGEIWAGNPARKIRNVK